MGYFRELPNMRYPSFLPDKNSSLEFVETKNLFRRIKLRDDFKNIFTLFDKFEIERKNLDEFLLFRNDILDGFTLQKNIFLLPAGSYLELPITPNITGCCASSPSRKKPTTISLGVTLIGFFVPPFPEP